MTTRLKTIEYALDMYTSDVVDATLTALTQTTIYIPEASPSFISVSVEIGFEDFITATGGTIGEHRVALSLGGAAAKTITELDDIANSGENMAGVIAPFDFTDHFIANWSGTSKTLDISVYFDQTTGTTLGMRNITALVIITYEYDDNTTTNPTQIKTVYIPLESLPGALPTVANTNFGSSQIPQLTGAGGLLVEDTPVIRDYFFLIEGNVNRNNNATDVTISVDIDSTGTTSFGTCEGALASDTFHRFIYRRNPATTTSSHNFQIWADIARFYSLTVTLIVTYEFNAANTTSVLNSIFIPMELASPLGQNTVDEASRFTRTLFIEEPETISLKQSAFRVNFNTGGAVTALYWRTGGQAYRAYSHLATQVCGMFSLQQRFDSDSSQGSGITLTRGLNNIIIDGYSTDIADDVTNINGYIILNYTSGLSSAGIGSHAHSVKKILYQWDAFLSDILRINNFQIAIPESNYWIVGSGFMFYQWSATASQAITFDVQCLGGESKGGGYLDIYTDAFFGDAERACSIIWMRGRDVFKRFANDADLERIDSKSQRDYRLYTTTTSANGLYSVTTYHTHSYTVSGTVSGYVDADGAGLTVNIYRADTNEKIGVATTTAGGAYTFTWHDNTIDLFAECYEDADHSGRSGNKKAS